MSADTSLATKIARLKQIYIESLPAKVKALRAIHTQLSSPSNITEGINALSDLTHKISGSAGSYDFHQISAVAHDLEYLCRGLQADNIEACTVHDIAKLRQDLQGLISMLEVKID